MASADGVRNKSARHEAANKIRMVEQRAARYRKRLPNLLTVAANTLFFIRHLDCHEYQIT